MRVNGVDSLPLVSLISFFIGMIIAFQTALQLKEFGSEIELAKLVALSLVRELGPVIGALIVGFLRTGAIQFYEELELAVLYLIAALVLLIRPTGLFGRSP